MAKISTKFGNRELWKKIHSQGGTAGCMGYIAQGTDEESGCKFFYGKVDVYTDAVEFT